MMLKHGAQSRMKDDSPIGLLWFGDPHLDDNGCDWPVLRRHVELVQENDAVYGCGLGDYQNNWIGRLSRLYAHQDTSHDTAWRLVEWFIQNINPLILVGGGHDMWTGAGDPLKWMTDAHSINEDWEAKVKIDFPNKRFCKILQPMTCWSQPMESVAWTKEDGDVPIKPPIFTLLVTSTTGELLRWSRFRKITALG